ncbi:MAG: diheme cytochrome c [Deltaproteobacteria bacterium]|nr:diheme cytochrome c [Deltaproteobacteria bacterium]
MKMLFQPSQILSVLGIAVALATGLAAGVSRADDDEDDEEEGEEEDEEGRSPSERGQRGASEHRSPGTQPGVVSPTAPAAAAPTTSAATASATQLPEAAAYQTECGACHLAYPPELLPARSWTRLMGGLDDHFGQNAELDAAEQATMTRWLERNAAEHSPRSLARRVLRDSQGQTPLRISELRFIEREHDEVSPQVWRRPAVGSVANCAACHRGAEKGSFSEHDIRIPR